ncbi:MAG: fibronectin type III domain-containing protein [Pirellulaceae bacterium]
MRSGILWFTASVCVCLPACADAPLEGTKPAQWRVTWISDPATTAIVSWNTAKPGSTHVLRFRIRGQQQPPTTVLAESGRFTGAPLELYYHHVRLTDLEPQTRYEVQMVSDRETSPWMYFLTAPADERPFSILHGGDSRSDQQERRAMNKMMSAMVHASFANEDPADDVFALAHGGDYIVSGVNLDQWSVWMSDHELTVGDDGRLLPVIPARGNHDKGKPFNEVFGFSEDDLNYYAIDIGKQLRFVTLNTEISTAGDQAIWLEDELSRSRPVARWLVAQYHRPAFPAVKIPSTAFISWVPLFQKYNVDLVCEADGHNIKRTVPIRNGRHDPTGVVYIGEGGLGVPQRTPKKDRWYLQSPGMADKGSHVFVLTFTDEALLGKCVLLDGTIRDQFSRQR